MVVAVVVLAVVLVCCVVPLCLENLSADAGLSLPQCIGSLCCDSAEEAKTLIPSLGSKIDDDVLQDLLDQMAKLQG